MQDNYSENVAKASSTYITFLKALEKGYYDPSLDLNRVTFWAIQGALTRLNPHAYLSLRNACDIKEGLGVEISKRPDDMIHVKRIAYHGAALRSEIQMNDVILDINGIAVTGMSVDEVEQLLCKDELLVMLTLLRGKNLLRIKIKKGRSVYRETHARLLKPDLVYLYITDMNRTGASTEIAIHLLLAEPHPHSKFVVDMRSMGGGDFNEMINFLALLLPPNTHVLTLERTGKIVTIPQWADPMYNDVVVLVNNNTASGGELIAAILQYHKRATIIGEPTSGFGTLLQYHHLSGKTGVWLPDSILLLPNGSTIEGMGVIPDIFVPDTIHTAHYQEGADDAILETAIDYLNKKRAPYIHAHVKTR